MSKHAARLRDGLTLPAGIVQGDARMGRAARNAAADVMLDDEILGTMQAAVSLILALEEQAETSAHYAKQVRAGLLAALEGTTGQVHAGIHTATVSKGRASVVITDPAAVPHEFLSQPAPQPDKAIILTEIKAGKTVPGAALRNGAPSLRIYVNNKDATE
jgi:hypothetical protein